MADLILAKYQDVFPFPTSYIKKRAYSFFFGFHGDKNEPQGAVNLQHAIT